MLLAGKKVGVGNVLPVNGMVMYKSGIEHKIDGHIDSQHIFYVFVHF